MRCWIAGTNQRGFVYWRWQTENADHAETTIGWIIPEALMQVATREDLSALLIRFISDLNTDLSPFGMVVPTFVRALPQSTVADQLLDAVCATIAFMSETNA